MEDTNIAQINIGDGNSLFGVFDGHGGSAVSLFCKVVMPRVLKRNLECLQHIPNQEDLIQTALKKTIRDMDTILLTKQGHRVMTFILLYGGEFYEEGLFPDEELLVESQFNEFLTKLKKY